jgi:hypothetical protein
MNLLRLAQGLLVLTVFASFLTWSTDPSESLAGVQTGPGQLVGLAALVGLVLIYLGHRVAWMAAALAAVICGRELLRISDNSTVDSGIGLWVTLIPAAVAAAVLVWQMFADVKANTPAD